MFWVEIAQSSRQSRLVVCNVSGRLVSTHPRRSRAFRRRSHHQSDSGPQRPEIRPDLENDEIVDWRRRGHRDADAGRGTRFYPALPHPRDMAPFIPLWNECRRHLGLGGRLPARTRENFPLRHVREQHHGAPGRIRRGRAGDRTCRTLRVTPVDHVHSTRTSPMRSVSHASGSIRVGSYRSSPAGPR